MTTAVVTVASQARAAHLAEQQRFLDALGRDDLIRVIGWLDAEAPDAEAPNDDALGGPAGTAQDRTSGPRSPADDGGATADRARRSDAIPVHAPRGAIAVHVPPGAHGLRVGEGRNRAASAALDAGADLLVFLDADCLPGPRLLPGYEAAAAARPGALLAGPVTYLADGVAPAGPDDLEALTAPHPARPAPPAGVLEEGRHDLFWSLSFAATPDVWRRLGGFDAGYEGYGAEDTDLGRRARAASVPLVWVGGADAYHQWHPISSPPWQHLDDILRNGARFAERWGEWPMGGWIEAFAAAGAIDWTGSTWRRADAAPAPAGRMDG